MPLEVRPVHKCNNLHLVRSEYHSVQADGLRVRLPIHGLLRSVCRWKRLDLRLRPLYQQQVRDVPDKCFRMRDL